jgi:hypothetical protein
VNSVSCEEKIEPTGTSNFALPLAVETGEVRSASPSSSVAIEKL